MSPFAKDLPFNNIQNVKQYLLYHIYITTMLQNFRRKICWHGIKWESQALLLHLHKITSPADKLGQKHCILTSDNRSASHFRVGYIYTTNKHFMIILPKSLNAEVFGKCYQFWRNKKKSTEQSRLDIYRDHSKFKSKDEIFLIQFLRILINHST